jgi:hypothetical protein
LASSCSSGVVDVVVYESTSLVMDYTPTIVYATNIDFFETTVLKANLLSCYPNA